ncbi:hypothetical protein Patl1_21441 [Pistacia atlantica]|uniref:Uncharacterized protein n=1 Tax=Pistacia atlantica TaxID=434234 RepID=A0ACC1BLK8_9ROSI|nr:hypothetical protein Patl1_21441 [Pistacia atlantica]
MALVLASTNLTTARIAAGCLALALFIVLFVAKNSVPISSAILLVILLCQHWTLRGLCIGFIIFLAVIWILQEKTSVRILRYVLLFIDIYDDLISRKVHSSDAEKFAEFCPCLCNGVGWGVICITRFNWRFRGAVVSGIAVKLFSTTKAFFENTL